MPGTDFSKRNQWGRCPNDLIPTEIPEASVALILLDIAAKQSAKADEVDAIGDWSTDKNRRSYYDGEDAWELVSNDPRVAILVDAANLLLHGRVITLPFPLFQKDQKIK